MLTMVVQVQCWTTNWKLTATISSMNKIRLRSYSSSPFFTLLSTYLAHGNPSSSLSTTTPLRLVAISCNNLSPNPSLMRVRIKSTKGPVPLSRAYLNASGYSFRSRPDAFLIIPGTFALRPFQFRFGSSCNEFKRCWNW